MTTTTRYSMNDEDYIYEELEEVIEAMRDETDEVIGQTYYAIECRPIAASDIVDPRRILEEFDDRLYDEVGECADSVCYSLPEEARTELFECLVAFIDKHKVLDGYWKTVGKSKELTVTEDDL